MLHKVTAAIINKGNLTHKLEFEYEFSDSGQMIVN